MSCHVVNVLVKLVDNNCSALLTADFYQWIPSYLFTHVVLILFGLWASHDKKGLEPVLAYIVAIAMTMLNDIILLGLYFSDSQDNAGII